MCIPHLLQPYVQPVNGKLLCQAQRGQRIEPRWYAAYRAEHRDAEQQLKDC